MLLKKIDYLPFLDQCWQEHLKPKLSNVPTVISLFAGCGGSSLGYSMAGFRELLAVEWDNNAVETFKLNFPEVPVYHGDICKLSIDEILNIIHLKSGELDVLDGSPPCQGFSTAGKRDIRDDRNRLFLEYVRILRGLQPKVFVMENVSGLVKGKMKFVFVEIIKELKQAGYKVSAKLLNTMYFGVLQSRKRIIFIGIRNNFKTNPCFPVAENLPITVEKALDDLQQDKTGSLLKSTWQMTRVLEGRETKKHFGLVRIAMDKPCSTIVKDAGNTSTGMIHPIENRRLSIPEIKRLSSYPDPFLLIGSYKEKWARIGNSVPPLFMYSIAKHIRKNILIQCITP